MDPDFHILVWFGLLLFCTVTLADRDPPLQTSSPVFARPADDVVLRCPISSAALSPDLTVEWTRLDGSSQVTVFAVRDGVELVQDQDPKYTGRTELTGKCSLKLINVQLQDNMTYSFVLLRGSSREHEGSVSLIVVQESEVNISTLKGSVVCESTGWNPMPQVSLLDSHRSDLRADTESSVGPDGLFSFSAATATLTGNGTIICRVQIPEMSLVKERRIHVEASALQRPDNTTVDGEGFFAIVLACVVLFVVVVVRVLWLKKPRSFLQRWRECIHRSSDRLPDRAGRAAGAEAGAASGVGAGVSDVEAGMGAGTEAGADAGVGGAVGAGVMDAGSGAAITAYTVGAAVGALGALAGVAAVGALPALAGGAAAEEEAEAGEDETLLGVFKDVMKINTTGAFDTAKANRLSITGIEASHELAGRDLTELQKYKEIIHTVGKKHHVPPALIAAIISRQSQAGTNLLNSGFGKIDPNCFGLMQINKIYHPVTGGAFSREHVDQGVAYLCLLTEKMEKKKGWSKEQHLKGALASYIAGEDKVNNSKYDDVDSVTPHGDFANDVIARWQWFTQRL
uniref:uncharacterized protein isoform X2 n=1 Tax=Semicossyphus pulcher TaxID=241346 RepID=UPI0037E99E92